MFKSTQLISFAPEASIDQRKEFAFRMRSVLDGGIEGLLRGRVSTPHSSSMNAGDLIVQLQFEDEEACAALRRSSDWSLIARMLSGAPVAHVDSVAYRPGRGEVEEPDIPTRVHRILILALRDGVESRKALQFEREMVEMPRYISAIRNWSFSRVVESGGSRRWSYVWEQDFADLGAFFGPYLMHPIHFGCIDRWFDTQSQDFIVDTHLCNVLTDLEGSFIAAP